MSALTPMSKTMVTITRQASMMDHLPAELITEYSDRKKALEATEAMIVAKAKELPEFKDGRLTEPMAISMESAGGITVKARLSVSIDGTYRKITSASQAHIDHTTLNLLINSKILTNDEKRQLLKDRNLLPIIEDDDSEKSAD